MASGVLSGCDRFAALGGHRPEPAGPDPLAPFHAATVRLAQRYDAVIAAQAPLADRLKALRDDHRAHAEALGRLLILPSATPASTPAESATPPVPADQTAVFNDLLAAEKAGLKEATDAALTAPAWIAPLVASIAACLATHVEVLS